MAEAMRVKSKRGSAMIEAVMVFPIVIMTAAAMLGLAVSVYSEADCVSAMHTEIRHEAGLQAETWESLGGADRSVSEEKRQSGILLWKQISGRWGKHGHSEAVIDEEEFIRWLNSGKRVLSQS